MFENLTEKLNRTFKKLKGHGKLSEKNIQDALKEVRLALLEADVNYKVVKKLVEAMNGKVWCESELGHGATFIVEFPVGGG